MSQHESTQIPSSMKRIQIVLVFVVAMAVTVTGCGHEAEPKGTATGDSTSTGLRVPQPGSSASHLRHDIAVVLKELDSLVGDSARGRQFILGVQPEPGGDTMVWMGRLPEKPELP